jgi:hypothetical protein
MTNYTEIEMIISEHLPSLIKDLAVTWNQFDAEIKDGAYNTNMPAIECQLRLLDSRFNWIKRAHTDTKVTDWDWLYTTSNNRFREFNMRGQELRN